MLLALGRVLAGQCPSFAGDGGLLQSSAIGDSGHEAPGRAHRRGDGIAGMLARLQLGPRSDPKQALKYLWTTEDSLFRP